MNPLLHKLFFSTSTAIAIFAPLSASADELNDTTTSRQLQELVVTASQGENLIHSTSMGQHSISDKMILSLPVMFGEPDIVKTLHTLPGVSNGTEGFTGMYVRGGENDQNLFIYNGLPLYQVSHIGGVFSSFNVYTIDKADFFKAAFPAEFGGRVSSILDISVKEPDFKSFSGKVSVGLLSANIYVTGPIIKEKTAFSAAVRRSWIDLFSIPALAIMNASNKSKHRSAHYSFTDLNLNIQHKFSPSASLSLTGYYGYDRLKLGLKTTSENLYGDSGISDIENSGSSQEDFNKLNWGNWGVTGSYRQLFNRSTLELQAYHSSYSSSFLQKTENQLNLEDATTFSSNSSRTNNSIYDSGVKGLYRHPFSEIYTLTAGAHYAHYKFHPDGISNEWISENENIIHNNGNPSTNGNELSAYISNALSYSIFSLEAGLRYSLFHTEGHSYSSLQPRAALRVMLTDRYSVKVSYSEMEQYMQQVSNNFINLPTDLWQPVTPKIKPLKSRQISAGVYGALPFDLYFSAEGWYKDLRNVLEYKEGVVSIETDLDWQDKITAGKGWAYGMDLSVSREIGPVTGTVSYGLLWNWRKFDELNGGSKFPSKYDNRNKININLSYQLNPKIEFNAGWTYMTGNRLTLSLYSFQLPEGVFPDAPGFSPGNGNDVMTDELGGSWYSTRNNVRMPAMHRLDLGMTIRQTYRNGHNAEWNISIYNAYCRMNALTIIKSSTLKTDDESSSNYVPVFQKLSILPIIPSFSYTYNF